MKIFKEGISPEWINRLIGIVGIIIIEIYALKHGVNGIAAGVSVGAIAGILGVKIGQAAQKKIDANGGQPG